MSTTSEIIRCKDPADLATRAADFIIARAQESIRDNGRFTLVLSGGSTPEKTYGLLAEPARAQKVDWAKTYLFLGDERFVSRDDPHSNFGMVRRSLLAHVPIAADHVFAMPEGKQNAVLAAAAYADELWHFFPNTALPIFDLILLGLGDDGHTASLFPGKPALDAEDVWVAASQPGVLPPPVDRVTLTFPVLNAARHVAFLVAGAKKAEMLRDVLQKAKPLHTYPAVGVAPVDGKLTWLVDEAAAQLLS